MSKEKEKWKPFPLNKRYLVSSLGRIKGPRIISIGTKNERGYHSVVIPLKGKRKTFRVHRMVIMTFVGASKLDCNHKNGDKSDNRLANLEYLTRKENIHHAISIGRWWGWKTQRRWVQERQRTIPG